jgi:arginyl-tRNA synthetase
MESLLDKLSGNISTVCTSINPNNQWKPKLGTTSFGDIDYALTNCSHLEKISKKGTNEIYQLIVDGLKDDIFDVSLVRNFINFKIKSDWSITQVNKLVTIDDILTPCNNKKKIVFDYSSPNVAKDMHVGHLRSTIIGDTLANAYSIMGHDVLKINHLGDFGLPFGMIIQYVLTNPDIELTSANLQMIYTNSKKMFDSDEEFKNLAYKRTVEFQQGSNDSDVYNLWKKICELSSSSYSEIYQRLNINLTEMGESFYKDIIPYVVQELLQKGLAQKLDIKIDLDKKITENDSRTVIFTPGDKTLTLLKSDGSYTYDTTDLAALFYRLTVQKADIVYYVVDSSQAEHFNQVFYVAKQAGWLTNQKLEHINFGIVLGEDGKRIRSRSGDTPKLIDLLNDGLDEAIKILTEKNSPVLESKYAIESLAYGSIKYADLSTCRTNNYVFSYGKMLNFKGNTLAYIMYAYVRISGIIGKIKNAMDNLSQSNDFQTNQKYLEITDSSEDVINQADNDLMSKLLKYGETVSKTINDNYPHILCTYLYELVEKFHSSYNSSKCIFFDEQNNIISINKTKINIYVVLQKIMHQCFQILNVNELHKM